MYQCRTPQISSNKAGRVVAKGLRIIKEWRAKSPGSRPYIRVRFLGRKGRVFIDDFHYHIDAKPFWDRVGRYRLLPCVRELLAHSTDSPETTSHGNLSLDGVTADGTKFRVIIRPEEKGGVLQSFYPL
jgi:hypothetical protein